MSETRIESRSAGLLAICLLTLAWLAPCGQAEDDTLPKCMARGARNIDADVEGEWTITSFVWGGISFPAMEGTEWSFHEGKLKAGSENHTYKLVPAQDGMSGIDLINESGGVFLGIYKVQGDHLTICHELVRKGKRPTAFTSPIGSGSALLTLKKKK